MGLEKVNIQGSLKCAAINTKVFQRRFLKLKEYSHDPWATCCVGHAGYMWVYMEGVVVGENMESMELRQS